MFFVLIKKETHDTVLSGKKSEGMEWWHFGLKTNTSIIYYFINKYSENLGACVEN
jgi:hypothetical protein